MDSLRYHCCDFLRLALVRINQRLAISYLLLHLIWEGFFWANDQTWEKEKITRQSNEKDTPQYL